MVVCKVCGRNLKSKKAMEEGVGCVCKKKLSQINSLQQKLEDFEI